MTSVLNWIQGVFSFARQNHSRKRKNESKKKFGSGELNRLCRRLVLEFNWKFWINSWNMIHGERPDLEALRGVILEKLASHSWNQWYCNTQAISVIYQSSTFFSNRDGQIRIHFNRLIRKIKRLHHRKSNKSTTNPYKKIQNIQNHRQRRHMNQLLQLSHKAVVVTIVAAVAERNFIRTKHQHETKIKVRTKSVHKTMTTATVRSVVNSWKVKSRSVIRKVNQATKRKDRRE